MKRKLPFILIGFALLLTACGSNNESAATDEDENAEFSPTTIELATVGVEGESDLESVKEFKSIVEEKTDGQVEVIIHPNGEAGTLREQTEQVQLVSMDITVTDMTVLNAFVESSMAFALPYALPTDQEKVYEILSNQEILDAYQKSMNEQGFQFLNFYDIGANQITTANKKIESIEDFKGLQMRVNPAEFRNKLYESWGATPLSVDFAELYSALQTGVADGQENSIETINATKIYEVQDYLAMTSHSHLIMAVFSNKEWFDSLDSNLQDVIVEAAEGSRDFQFDLVDNRSEEVLDKVTEHLEIVEIDQESLNVMKEKAEEIRKQYKDDSEGIDRLLNVIEEHHD